MLRINSHYLHSLNMIISIVPCLPVIIGNRVGLVPDRYEVYCYHQQGAFPLYCSRNYDFLNLMFAHLFSKIVLEADHLQPYMKNVNFHLAQHPYLPVSPGSTDLSLKTIEKIDWNSKYIGSILSTYHQYLRRNIAGDYLQLGVERLSPGSELIWPATRSIQDIAQTITKGSMLDKFTHPSLVWSAIIFLNISIV